MSGGLLDLSSSAGLPATACQGVNADRLDWLNCEFCKRRILLTVAADEVLPGDLMRDQVTVREVAEVSTSVVAWAIRVAFRPVPGRCRGLTVPLFVPVTVWRVAGDG